MIFNPYFWIALLAICSACYVAGCTEGHKGVAKVQAAWEADKAERKAEVERVNKEREDATAKATADAAREQAARDANFADLAKRNAALDKQLGACNNDRALLRRLRDTVNTANAAVTGAPAEPAKNTAAAAVPTGIADWFDQVGKLYADCRQEVIDWNVWYDGLKAAR